MKLPRILVPLAVASATAALAGCAATSAGSPIPTSSAANTSDFSSIELATICVDATVSAFASDVTFDSASVRVERREVEPEWLVLVPATTGGHDGQAQCTIGGTPEAPEIEMSSASIEPLPEEQVARLIKGENEGGTK